MISLHRLYWNVLRWNFDVKCVDVILGHKSEYRGSMSRLPIFGAQKEARRAGMTF